MKLVIRRDQADVKGVFGGHKGVSFSLTFRLVLTDREQSLVERYKLAGHLLTPGQYNGQQFATNSVANLVAGVTQTMPSVEVLVSNENAIKDACRDFKLLLDVAATFGGEEVVEIESPLDLVS